MPQCHLAGGPFVFIVNIFSINDHLKDTFVLEEYLIPKNSTLETPLH